MYELYGRLAEWWPLLSDPADYKEEADLAFELLRQSCHGELLTVLELGGGGGNLASHLKQRLQTTLSDVSPAMVQVSRASTGGEHIVGDMRDLRLRCTFDAVLVHDAISYMTTRHDLVRALETCTLHCRPGGALLLMPDCLRESFQPKHATAVTMEQTAAPRYLSWSCILTPQELTLTHHRLRLRDA